VSDPPAVTPLTEQLREHAGAHPFGPDADASALDPTDVLFTFLGWVEDGGRPPWPHQEQALLELAAGNHVILKTPTGSGKSLVALGLHALAWTSGERSVYTAPIKALVNEKFFALCKDLGAENVGLMTGDASVNRDAPILCCTAEVLAQLALTEGDRAGLRHVVMDEFHYYGDRDRGMAWQLPLILLKKTRFLLLSATLGDTAPIQESIEDYSGRDVSLVTMETRPVPLFWEYAMSSLHETVDRLKTRNKLPAYLVHPSQREATEQAQNLLSQDFLDKPEKKALAVRLRGVRFPSPFGPTLKRYLLHGVGLHHAGLLPRYRLLVEQLAQEGKLAAISGTDTLGVGVNVPIRTVVMSSLSRWDGQKVGWPTVRDFHQVAGRAGRAGFDTEGLVVIMAPPWAVENAQRSLKAQAKGKKRFRKAQPPDRVKPWNEATFIRLRDGAPENLSPVFRVTPGLILEILRREHRRPSHRFGGYGALIDLIRRSHLAPHLQRAEVTRASQVFRGLRKAGVIRLVPMVKGGGKRVVPDPDLPRDLSLTHALSLWLVEAVVLLDSEEPDHALDVVSVVESIVEDPHAVLRRQVSLIKGEVVAELKAQGVEYEERMEILDKITHPKPKAEWLTAVFEPWSAAHPWVEARGPRPKSIVRDMVERGATFSEYVRELGLARGEGVLLRYLAQVWRILARGLPVKARTPEVLEIVGWLRGVLATTDDSLIRTWESLASGEPLLQIEAPEEDVSRDPRAFRGRLRAEMQAVVSSLAAQDWDGAADALVGEAWEAADLKRVVAPVILEHRHIRTDHAARLAQHLVIRREAPGRWIVDQSLLDAEDETIVVLRGLVESEPGAANDGPVLSLIDVEVL
jgi:hypothetical protein